MDETSPGSFLVAWFGTTSVESLVSVAKVIIIIIIIIIIIFYLICYKTADHSGPAV
jgi:flagellar biosynthesis/type III secretory pathway M-ring protein FliF/YscJ